jgi:hypothetical protein
VGRSTIPYRRPEKKRDGQFCRRPLSSARAATYHVSFSTVLKQLGFQCRGEVFGFCAGSQFWIAIHDERYDFLLRFFWDLGHGVMHEAGALGVTDEGEFLIRALLALFL